MKKNFYNSLLSKQMTILISLLFLFSGYAFAQWTVYDGSVLPSENEPAFVVSSGSFNETENAIIDDPDIAGNKLLWMDISGNPQNAFLWRMNFAALEVELQELTVVMRVKGHEERDMALDLDMHFNDIRSRISVHTATRLARIRNGSGTNDTIANPVTEWTIYRVTMTATETRLYVDESTQPVLTFTPQSAAHANRHFRFGDGDSGNSFGADIDWVIWDVNGAYAPGEGTAIPDTLLPEEPAEDGWFVYDGSVLPAENDPVFGTSGLAGAGIVTELVNDPNDAENSLLKLLTLVNADNGSWRHVYPESVTDVTVVMRVKSADDNGRRVLELDLENGGFRERLYINQEDNLLRLQHSAGFGANNEFPLPDNASVREWNIYRLTKNAEGHVKLYINENPVPLAEGTTSVTNNNNHFRFGDTNGSHNISALIDWIIWDTSGAYGPDEGLPIPDGLSTAFYEPEEPEVHNWKIYDGRNLPSDQHPLFDESNLAGAGGTNILVTDPGDETNGFLHLATETNSDNFMWRNMLDADTPGITFVMKVKSANPEARRVVELDLHHNGIRERLYINQQHNRVRLNQGIGGGDGGEIEPPEGVDLKEWNIYRLTKSGNDTKLYLNEDTVPLATGTTTTATTQQYFRFGDGNGSHNAAALIDYIIWDETGAYAPGEGSAVPRNVKTPNWDATLASLLVDGGLIGDFNPDTTFYEIILPQGTTIIPAIDATLNYEGATLEVVQATELPGEATVVVTAFNGFTVRTYTVSFVPDPTSAKFVEEDVLHIYPNPAISSITLERSNSDSHATIRIINLHGQVMMQDLVSERSHHIDVSQFNTGIYIIQVIEKGQTTEKKFIKQ